METTYDVYRRRYLVGNSSHREAAEVEAEADAAEDAAEAELPEHIQALKQQLAKAEAELAEAEART